MIGRGLGKGREGVLGRDVLGLGSLSGSVVQVVVEGDRFTLGVLGESKLELASNSHDLLLRGSASPNSETIGLLSDREDCTAYQALLRHGIFECLSNAGEQSINPAIIEGSGALLG